MRIRPVKKTFFITALAFLTVSTGVFAQDTIKKYKPKPVVKPAITAPAAAVKTYPPKPVKVIPKTVAPAPTVAATLNPYAATPPAPTDRSINGQYQYLLTKLYGYQRPMMSAFYKSVTDTLHGIQKQLKPLKTNVAALQDTAKELHKELASQKEKLDRSSTEVDNIVLLGASMTKSTYNMLMWGLVVVFGIIAAIVITRSGGYAREAKNRIKLYEDLEEEHKNYKAKANEKEKKLARELQTARNKLEELTGNPNY